MKARTATTIATAVSVIAMILPSVAAGHVDISPSEAAAGKPTRFSFTVGHDCDGAATIGLDAQVPGGVTDYTAKSVAGWKAVTRGKRMKWTGGPNPEGTELALPFRATVYGDMGDQIPFKVIQICEGGAETAWIQTGGGTAEGDDPAPLLTLTSSKAAPKPPVADPTGGGTTGEEQVAEAAPAEVSSSGADEDSGGVGIGPIVGLVLIVASLTAFVVIRRGKKNSG
jgi:uncharacterized protein YcnI